MNFAPLDINVDLIDDKVRFIGALRDNSPITVDYVPPIGSGQGYTSLELFLMSFATCLGSSVLLVTRKMHKTITGCRVHAHGERRQEHPTGFQRIEVELELCSPDATDSDIAQALRIAEDSLCPVWGMIKGNVEVVASYRLLADVEMPVQQV